MNGYPTPSKVLLIADHRPGAREVDGTPIRRFRLARLGVERRALQGDARFEHLRRAYD